MTTQSHDPIHDENVKLRQRVRSLRAALEALVEDNRQLRQLVARQKLENEHLRATSPAARTGSEQAERVRSMLRASRSP